MMGTATEDYLLGAMETATEDYRLGAMGGSADCCGLYLEVLWEQPAAISRYAHSTQQVVFSKPFEPNES